MRYFVRCSYNGTRYHGWQAQRGDVSTIQSEIESILSKLLRKKIDIVGCGRTDTGVHAADYVFHFDADAIDQPHLLYKLNRISSEDLAFANIERVDDDAHARFHAVSRSYRYHILDHKDPFRHELIYYHPMILGYDRELLERTASLLLEFDDFTTFCKEGSDVVKKKCLLTESRWEYLDGEYVYHITSNRFLRGMIRLIVGMHLNVASGKLSIDDVRHSLENQERLPKDLSVPGSGLFLDKIIYPDLKHK